MSLINKLNRAGPKTVPSGTPDVARVHLTLSVDDNSLAALAEDCVNPFQGFPRDPIAM